MCDAQIPLISRYDAPLAMVRGIGTSASDSPVAGWSLSVAIAHSCLA